MRVPIMAPCRAAVLTAFVGLILGCDGVATKRVAVVVDEAAVMEQAPIVVIALQDDGSLSYDGEACDLTDLRKHIDETLAAHESSGGDRAEVRYQITAGPETDNSMLVAVMFELSQAGVKNVGIANAD